MVKVTPKSGYSFSNPLKLSEAYLIPKMAKENKELTIKIVEVLPETYDVIFNR